MEGNGWLLLSGDTAADGADATSEWGWDLEIPSPVGGNGRGGNAGDRNLLHLLIEYSHSIYCDKANNGPMSDDYATSRDSCFKAAVRAGDP